MRFCEECGAVLEDGAKFCEECGAVVEPIPDENIEKEENVKVEETLVELEIKPEPVKEVKPEQKPQIAYEEKSVSKKAEPGKETNKESETGKQVANQASTNKMLIGGLVAIIAILLIVVGILLGKGMSNNKSTGTDEQAKVTSNQEAQTNESKDLAQVTESNSEVQSTASAEDAGQTTAQQGNTNQSQSTNSSKYLFGDKKFGYFHATKYSDSGEYVCSFEFQMLDGELSLRASTADFHGQYHEFELYNIDGISDIEYGKEYSFIGDYEVDDWGSEYANIVTISISPDHYCTYKWEESMYRVDELLFDHGIPAVNTDFAAYDSEQELYSDWGG